ncbi:hypothetical protein N7492_009919 [Penicillium capsulatum]|uniref:Uncharacterized protein n=1 Tax=Penicillium capsulatum TaxID=69766 RepID=A0A9W9HMH6_9EURO|nr:hypothetical protein N7492_009919 [Penicillium capsulatum]KAJ6112430.1 hypothetical protein N7512_007754 [Penicillium capsulatum]
MPMDRSDPLFIAQEALCFYPISTIYDSCPRYLFYALLLASCVTRWTGWLADVFLGAAATYAGTAAIESFILVSSPVEKQPPAPVNIPYLRDNTTLWSNFPQLITQTDHVLLQPAAIDLDSDAVLAIVVTGYLVFLPLQCWSRVLSNDRARNLLFCLWNFLMLAGSVCSLVNAANVNRAPTQYMFCYPEIPPYDDTSSDGWQPSWRTSTWNSSVWEIFSNSTHWGELGDICYNPCFNTSQILRQSTSLQSWVASKDSKYGHPKRFWRKLVYSKRYIYSLIILCLILNCVLLTFKFLPYESGIPSSRVVVIWRERKAIWNSFRDDLQHAFHTEREDVIGRKEDGSSRLHRLRPVFTFRFCRACLRVIADVAILFGLLFSMIIIPLTVIAFVVWIEWCIHHDGPQQENPQQVGQWSYLVSIGLLLLSAAILMLKYRLATRSELDTEIDRLQKHLAKLEMRREALSDSETSRMTSENAAT